MGRVSNGLDNGSDIILFIFLTFRYPICEATWETDDSMADPHALLTDFKKAAEAEGIDLDTEDTIVLKEAKLAACLSS